MRYVLVVTNQFFFFFFFKFNNKNNIIPSHKQVLPCSYNCGGLLSAPKNCTGHSYKYTSTSTAKCGDKHIIFDEYEEFKKKGMNMCRCSKNQQSGDCWVDFPGFTAGKSYPCTVMNTCQTFDLSNPSDYRTTGEVNIVLGVFFIFFSICPESCAISTSLFFIAIFAYLIPMVQKLIQICFYSINAWLMWMIDFTGAPAKAWVNEEEKDPLLP